MLQNIHRVDETLCGDCHIKQTNYMLRPIHRQGSVMAATAESVYAKVYAGWVPRFLTVARKERKEQQSQLISSPT
jgi:hypothetical protein